QALQKVAQNEYDAVLMDCQMPVMDGYETTRRLRAMSRFATLPVIAMTANAMVGDKEKCFAAGMNDFIAKPIDVEQLFLVLARWARPKPPALQDNRPGDSVASVDVDVDVDVYLNGDVDASQGVLPAIEGLQIESALRRMGGNAKLLYKLLDRFRLTQRNAMQRITQALAINDTKTATREAHTLRGLAGNIGAFELVECAARLEALLKHAPTADLPQRSAAMEPLEQALNALIAKLDVAIPRLPDDADDAPSAQPAVAVDKQALARDILELSRLLKDDDARAAKDVESLHGRLQAMGQVDSANALRDLVAAYQFDDALRILQNVALALEGEHRIEL
ncbi:MAG: response regulator, partial [Rhodoferax sp.]|nr:response regulator [Rhodoferax sp.]